MLVHLFMRFHKGKFRRDPNECLWRFSTLTDGIRDLTDHNSQVEQPLFSSRSYIWANLMLVHLFMRIHKGNFQKGPNESPMKVFNSNRRHQRPDRSQFSSWTAPFLIPQLHWESVFEMPFCKWYTCLHSFREVPTRPFPSARSRSTVAGCLLLALQPPIVVTRTMPRLQFLEILVRGASLGKKKLPQVRKDEHRKNPS
jgi:hypothetical protein